MTTSSVNDPDRITQLFPGDQPAPPEIGPAYVDMARAIAGICATRILLLIAVLTGSAIWAWTAYDPTRDRLYVAVAYSLVAVLPLITLHWRRG